MVVVEMAVVVGAMVMVTMEMTSVIRWRFLESKIKMECKNCFCIQCVQKFLKQNLQEMFILYMACISLRYIQLSCSLYSISCDVYRLNFFHAGFIFIYTVHDRFLFFSKTKI